MNSQKGLILPPWETMVAYHPQFALAAWCGVPVRPNVRTLSFDFSSDAPGGTPVPSVFGSPISTYSIFVGCDVLIDPTASFANNVLKTLSDTLQARVSGMTMTLQVDGREGHYTPIADDCPLGSVAEMLNVSAGSWSLDNPENLNAKIQIQAPGPAAPFAVWMPFTFLILGAGTKRGDYMVLSRAQARKCLRDEGATCWPAGLAGNVGEPPKGA